MIKPHKPHLRNPLKNARGLGLKAGEIVTTGTLLALHRIDRFSEVCMRYGAVVLFVGLVGGVSSQQASDPMRQAFLQRVDEYTALHRQLEGPLPREVVTADLQALFAPRREMAAAVRTVRANARQGDIFSPPVAEYFRTLVADALRAGGIRNMLAIVKDEDLVHIPARVNADYPAGRSIAMMPSCLLAALPPLPPELRYGFVGRDLILWDTHAGLIVDFVPHAIPETT